MFVPPELLDRVWLYTNFDCNLSCSYCVLDLPLRNSQPRLEWSVFRRLIDQAVSCGFRQVALTGGEPFLHPDIAAMLEYATSRLDTLVLTNAMLLDPARLQALERVDRTQLTLQVSLNSGDPRAHDEWRGSGTWGTTRRGLQLAMEAGFKVAVRATLDGPDDASLNALRESLVPLGIVPDRVYGVPVARVGRAQHGVELTRKRVWPEPTVIGNGLYWYPLLISPGDVVVPAFEDLRSAMEILTTVFHEVAPTKSKEVR